MNTGFYDYDVGDDLGNYFLDPSDPTIDFSKLPKIIQDKYNSMYSSFGVLGVGNNPYSMFGTPPNNSLFYSFYNNITPKQVKLSPDLYSFFLIGSNNTLWVLGDNSYGILGTSDIVTRSVLTQIPGNNWYQVESCIHTTAIKTDGTLWAWGHNGYGGLGDGTTVHKSSPVQIGSNTNWKQVSCGYIHTTAIKTDGTLWAWGHNLNGQLGDGTTVNKSSPVQVGSNTNWKQVSCAQWGVLAIKTDGTLWAWGNNSNGQLGDGTTVNKSSPVQVGIGKNWKLISAGLVQTVGVGG